MFLCSFNEELCTKEENNKTSCSFNFEHQCIYMPLTPAYCSARLQWCLARSDWNGVDWGRKAFSDESRFHLCPDYHRRHVWKHPGQRADPALLVHATQTFYQELWSGVPFPLTAGPLSSSLATHLQHSGTWTTFWDLFCYRSFRSILALFFSYLMRDYLRHVLLWAVLHFKHFLGLPDRQISLPSSMSAI